MELKELYTTIFASQTKFKIIDKFELDNDFYTGKILIETLKNSLEFSVLIPINYPLKSLHFFTKSIENYPHLGPNDTEFGGALCIHVPFINKVETKLKWDIESLNSWIEKYYINDEIDEYFEYRPIETNMPFELVFSETINDYNQERFQNNKFGEFYFVNIGKEMPIQMFGTYMALNFGNVDYKWNSFYKQKKKFKGYWVFIEQPPFIENKPIKYWSEIQSIFPDGFIEYLNNQIENYTKKDEIGNDLPDNKIIRLLNENKVNVKFKFGDLPQMTKLGIGYLIKSGEKFEVHWDLINLIIDKKQDELVSWYKTKNSSYERFFGRGSIDIKIAKSKILIIGIGAIGSSLSEILIRTGCIDLTIADYDIVETGNICRSVYDFSDITELKTKILQKKLFNISPFAEINIFDVFEVLTYRSKNYKNILSKLASFDIIFDCTANKEVLQMLTDFNLSNIYHISITDKAKNLLCISNSENFNLFEKNEIILNYLKSGNDKPTFREGTGCYSPTFQASYFDINTLLNFSVQEINRMYINDKKYSFFTIHDDNTLTINKEIYFKQKQLGLSLIITTKCINEIQNLVYLHYPNEFGGYLLGSYSDNYKECLILDILIPLKYDNGTDFFKPEKSYMNERLNEIRTENNDKLRYLGEWHSHPNITKYYSQTDFNSISMIANSENVSIKNPIMLIISFGKNYFYPTFYIFANNKLYEYEQID